VSDECICKGNFRQIVTECESLIGTRFKDHFGESFILFGIVWGDDDFYYGMYDSVLGIRLLSCVGSLEGHGYTVDGDEKRA
jgi:hypothetical protein